MVHDEQDRSSSMFSSVDELGEAVQRLGWKVEYRQMRRGTFSAELSNLESEGIRLTSARFNSHLLIPSEPPESCVGLFFPRLDAGSAGVFSRNWAQSDLVVLPSQSELEIVTHGVIRNETLFLGEADFLAIARDLVPGRTLLSPKTAAIHRGDSKRLAAIVQEIDFAQCTGVLDTETVSNLLASIILWLAETISDSTVERLANGVSATVARRAQTFIEERLHEPIRMHDLSAAAGVGLRTLQRCFAEHFQLTPTEYIKAQRLSAARWALLSVDSSNLSITEIATRNGFTHLGRFSVDYRAHFGESPSQTRAAGAVAA